MQSSRSLELHIKRREILALKSNFQLLKLSIHLIIILKHEYFMKNNECAVAIYRVAICSYILSTGWFPSFVHR